MNASVATPRAAASLVAEVPVLEREIALMERAIALYDRHAALKRQMEERNLTLVNSAMFMSEIAELVATKHGLTAADLVGPSMLKPICVARHEAMWLMDNRKKADNEKRWSRSQIGRFFNRDHTTVINGVRRHEERRAAEIAAARQIINQPIAAE